MRRLLGAAFHLAVIAALISSLVTLLRNLRILKSLEDERPPEPGREPSISVLIPARDEERALPRLLDSLQKQAYARYSVTVLDDDSSDGTADVVRQFEEADSRFRQIEGKPLPDGLEKTLQLPHG